MRAPVALLTAVLVAAGLAGCTAAKDEDGDGLFDSVERKGWTVTVDLVLERVRRHVTSDPHDADSDDDGFTDREELLFPGGLDPRSADTDGDGLTDCQEALHAVVAECTDPAFQGPFRSTGTIANNADSDHGVSRYVLANFRDTTGTLGSTISWGDGLSDGDELAGFDVPLPSGGTRRVTTDPLSGDSDGDQLEDGEEILLHRADPRNADTDGDGCGDGFDPFPIRRETYRVGLQTFTLRRPQDPLGGADLSLEIVMAGNALVRPAQGGLRVEDGQTVSLASLDVGELRPADPCSPDTRTPWLRTGSPWVYLGFTARDADGTGLAVLDIHTLSGSDEPALNAQAYWNPVTDRFSWRLDGARDFPGPLRLSGADGVLVVQPSVS